MYTFKLNSISTYQELKVQVSLLSKTFLETTYLYLEPFWWDTMGLLTFDQHHTWMVQAKLEKRSLLIAINCLAGMSIFFFGWFLKIRLLARCLPHADTRMLQVTIKE